MLREAQVWGLEKFRFFFFVFKDEGFIVKEKLQFADPI